jgi:cobalt-zinc-cadmium efflux system protein
VVSEAGAGWFANSLALISDAGHNLSDALALGLSYFAIRASRRPPDDLRTYGYHRLNILAALANALLLVGIGVIILWEAGRHLIHPEPVHGTTMIYVALAAIVVNLVIGFWLSGGKSDLNVRSAYLHMLGDAVSAVGVVVAGIIVNLTGWKLADPLVSLLIGGLIIASSWGILRESVGILMESTPSRMVLTEVEQAIRDTQGVLDAHDLHVWTITSNMLACSCHIVVDDQSARDGQLVQRAVAGVLASRFHIEHATIQVEVECCEADNPCAMHPGNRNAIGSNVVDKHCH